MERLPDAPGWVAWLQAPYGFGKSVLASQWAELREAAGTEVAWVHVGPRGVLAAAVETLGLPHAVAGTDLVPAMRARAEAWVFDDVPDGDDVAAVVDGAFDLSLVLSGRGRLVAEELPRLRTAGRLVHVPAADLAFTRAEAAALFDDPAAADRAWHQAQGWPLPVHFASLSGGSADPEAFLEGVRSSLSADVWREALLLATLGVLPPTACIAATAELARSGFAQSLDGGVRLNPWVAGALVQRHRAEAQDAVRAAVGRLPPAVAAAAMARTDLLDELRRHLEEDLPAGRLGSLDPEGYLEWDARCGGAPGPSRLLSRAWALSVTGRSVEALSALDGVADHPDATAAHRLTAVGWRVFELAPDRVDEVDAWFAEAEPLLATVAPGAAASFLANASVFYYKRQDWRRVATLQERALVLLRGEDDPASHVSVVAHRLAEMRWELDGDLTGYLAASLEQLRVQGPTNPYNAMVAHHELGVLGALVGDPAADEHLRAAAAGADTNAIVALVAAAERAARAADVATFAELARRFRPWREAFPEMHRRVHELWARTLRRTGSAVAALDVLEGVAGVGAAGERALASAAAGVADAAARFPDPSTAPHRRTRLELLAARFVHWGEVADLEALVAATNVGARLLPALVPIDRLPVARPEFADAYPIADVLASRRSAAIERRLDAVPPLEVDFLGSYRVRVLGSEVPLTAKQRDHLALLAIGLDRAALAEAMWPELSKAKQQNNLDVQRAQLRRVLEPWGVRTYLGPQGLERSRVDLWRLREALRAGDAEAVARSYREPLAPGVDLPELDAVRTELRASVIALWGRAASASTEDAEAANWLGRIVDLEPLDEAAVAALVARLVASGRRAEALRRYRTFAAALKREVGVAPSPETAAPLGALCRP